VLRPWEKRGWRGIRLRTSQDPEPGDAMTHGDAFSYVDHNARTRMGTDAIDVSPSVTRHQSITDDLPEWAKE